MSASESQLVETGCDNKAWKSKLKLLHVTSTWKQHIWKWVPKRAEHTVIFSCNFHSLQIPVRSKSHFTHKLLNTISKTNFKLWWHWAIEMFHSIPKKESTVVPPVREKIQKPDALHHSATTSLSLSMLQPVFYKLCWQLQGERKTNSISEATFMTSPTQWGQAAGLLRLVHPAWLLLSVSSSKRGKWMEILKVHWIPCLQHYLPLSALHCEPSLVCQALY